jgi:hypothetical protein
MLPEEHRQFRTPSRNEGLDEQKGKSSVKNDENDNDDENFELFGNSKSAKKMPDPVGESSTRRSAVEFCMCSGNIFSVHISSFNDFPAFFQAPKLATLSPPKGEAFSIKICT